MGKRRMTSKKGMSTNLRVDNIKGPKGRNNVFDNTIRA